VNTTSNRKAPWLQRVSRRLRILTLMAFAVLVMCPISFYLFEHNHTPEARNLGSGYQWLFRTLFETTSAYKLHTAPGFVTYYIVRVAGVSLVAFATGTIASRLVTTVILRGKGMGASKASGHILICGWSSKGSEIIRELKAKEVEDTRPIVVLADLTDDPTKDDRVEFIRGIPSNGSDLERARLRECDTAIILSDESNPTASDHERDAFTLLTALAVEVINPDCYSCVEVIQAENKQHFARTRVNEVVVSAELTGALLAGSARTHGLSRIVGDLVTHPDGQEFHRMDVPASLGGAKVMDALIPLKQEYNALLVAIVTPSGDYVLNPPADRVLNIGEELLVISSAPDP
jgi:voltage-gated potassium channel